MKSLGLREQTCGDPALSFSHLNQESSYRWEAPHQDLSASQSSCQGGWTQMELQDVAMPALHQSLNDTFGNGGFIYCGNPSEQTTKFK